MTEHQAKMWRARLYNHHGTEAVAVKIKKEHDGIGGEHSYYIDLWDSLSSQWYPLWDKRDCQLWLAGKY